MKQSTLLALIAPILALAKPLKHERLHKRHEITSTIYEEVTVTVDITVTVYVPASEASASAEVTLDKPADNEAKPTGNVVAKVEASNSEPPKEAKKEETPKSTEVEAKSPIDHQKEQEELQEKQKQIQEDLIKQQEGHKAEQKGYEVKQPEVKQPEPKQPEPKQPEPKQEPKQTETKDSNTQSSGSAPSGGSCGEVGGKCLASDVTIYDDQGIGACGWQNDTNSEDYFALAAGEFDSFIDAHTQVLTIAHRNLRRLHERRTRASQEQILWPHGYDIC